MRRRSKVEVYLHLIWLVKGRQERITADFEPRIYRCIVGEAEAMDCQVLAIGGMPDHVHLLVRVPGKVAPAMLAKQVKSLSSNLIHQIRPDFSDRFDWQPGYGCFSLGRNLCETVKHYVLNQKQHHSDGKVWPDWEEADEPELAAGASDLK